MSRPQVILIGSSAGGVTAVQRILRGLPEAFPIPIVVVLHLPPTAHLDPSLVFGSSNRLIILEANDKMPIEKQHIYFAPPNYHLLIEKNLSFALSQDEPVHYSPPSIDVMFETAAIAYGDRACGILLTGANSDGAAGLKFIQKMGGLAYVQDPTEAEAKAMPKAAIDITKPDFIGSLDAISDKIRRMADQL